MVNVEFAGGDPNEHLRTRRDSTFVGATTGVTGGSQSESGGREMTDDDDVKRMDQDTPTADPGDAIDQQGVGQNPTDSTETDRTDPRPCRVGIDHR